jgi:hypothetical protein
LIENEQKEEAEVDKKEDGSQNDSFEVQASDDGLDQQEL